MTEDELAAIEARAKAATSGPWVRVAIESYHNDEMAFCVKSVPTGHDIASNQTYYPDAVTPENQLFIAHARTDVPALVAEVRRLRKALTEAEWVMPLSNSSESCSICGSMKHWGHVIGCYYYDVRLPD
jgi:hypothetical protein